MNYAIHTLTGSVVSRRRHGFPEAEALFEAHSDAETAELQAMARLRSTDLSDIRAKAVALRATPFFTDGMTDAPAPGELELLGSILADLSTI